MAYENVTHIDMSIGKSGTVLTTLTADDFEESSLTIRGTATSGSDFTIGGTCLKEMTLTLTRSGMSKLASSNLLRRKACLHPIIVYNSGETDDKGYFYITELKVYDYYAELVCYDGMVAFDEKVPELVLTEMRSSHTIEALYQLCVSNCSNRFYELSFDSSSIAVNKGVSLKLAEDSTIDTYRNCLEFLTAIAGGFCEVDTSGTLIVKYYGKTVKQGVEIEPDDVMDVYFDPFMSKIAVVKTSVGGFDYVVGSETSSDVNYDQLTVMLYENPFLRGFIAEGEESKNPNVETIFNNSASTIIGYEMYGGYCAVPARGNISLGDVIKTTRGIVSKGSNTGVDLVSEKNIMVNDFTWSYQNQLMMNCNASVSNINPSSSGLNKGNVYRPYQRPGGGGGGTGEDSRLDGIADNLKETKFARKTSSFKAADYNVKRVDNEYPQISNYDIVLYSDPIDLSGVEVNQGGNFYVNIFSCIFGFTIVASNMLYQMMNRRKPSDNNKWLLTLASFFDPKIRIRLGIAAIDSGGIVRGYVNVFGSDKSLNVGQKYGDLTYFSEDDQERMRESSNYLVNSVRMLSLPLQYDSSLTYRFFLSAKVYDVLLSVVYKTDKTSNTPGAGSITNVTSIDLNNDYNTWGGDSGISKLGGKSYNELSTFTFDFTYTLGSEAEYGTVPFNISPMSLTPRDIDVSKTIYDAINGKTGLEDLRYLESILSLQSISDSDKLNLLSLMDGYDTDTPLRNFVSAFSDTSGDIETIKQDILNLKEEDLKINEDIASLGDRVTKLEEGSGGETPTGVSKTPIARYTNESEVVIDSSHSDVLSLQLEIEKDINTMLSFSATGGMSSEGLLDFHVFYDNSEIAFNPKFFVSKPYETISFSTSFLPISKDKRVTLSITCTTSDASINFLKDSISVSVINAELPKSDTEFHYAIEDFVVPVSAVQLLEINDSATTQ